MDRFYRTIDGRVLDLSALGEGERSFLRRCYAAYLQGTDSAAFNNTFLAAPANPLLRADGSIVTRDAWTHLLYVIPHDLGDRLGIKQGSLAPEGDVDHDPFDASVRGLRGA